MDRNELLTIIREIMQDIFEVPPQAVTESTTYRDIPGWDSMNHIILIATIEDAVPVHFELDDYAELKSVAQLLDYIEARKGC